MSRKTQEPIIKQCESCGKEFEVVKRRINSAKYCSIKCYNKNRIAWNKNLTKEDPRVKKYALQLKDRKFSEKTKAKMSKTRKRLIKEGKIKVIEKGETKETNPALQKISDLMKGELNSQWKGGTSSNFYHRIARENLIQKCCLCNSNKFLCIHHKDKNRSNNDLNNLMMVCKSCHSKIHEIAQNINGDK